MRIFSRTVVVVRAKMQIKVSYILTTAPDGQPEDDGNYLIYYLKTINSYFKKSFKFLLFRSYSINVNIHQLNTEIN